jgi:flavin reductase (DIM6/NTAB) family NADH-FMN oxidoreductase RutF
MMKLDPTPSLPARAAPSEAFRAAMRNLAGGVCVVTVGSGEERTGLTATSVSSLSLDPPTLVVCISRAASAFPALLAHRTFGVNVLGGHHRDVAERFAGRGGLQGAARYAGADWIALATGAPLLADALAGLDCVVEKLDEWHTHAIVIGRVVAMHAPGGEAPLVYWQGGYLG